MITLHRLQAKRIYFFNHMIREYMSFIAHRANTLKSVYNLYHNFGVRAFEIDVQRDKEGNIIVFHDDIWRRAFADLNKYHKDFITLEDYLTYTPDDILVNIEVKKYHEEDEQIVNDIIAICKMFRGKRFMFSSFHLPYAQSLRGVHLHETMKTLKKTSGHIGIHVSFLYDLDRSMYKDVYVWGLFRKHAEELKRLYPWVSGWIVDY